MAATFVKEGNSFDFYNDTGADLPMGIVLKRGALVGVTKRVVPAGKFGSAAMQKCPIFRVDVNTAVTGSTYSIGDIVDYDDVTGFVEDAGTGSTGNFGIVLPNQENEDDGVVGSNTGIDAGVVATDSVNPFLYVAVMHNLA